VFCSGYISLKVDELQDLPWPAEDSGPERLFVEIGAFHLVANLVMPPLAAFGSVYCLPLHGTIDHQSNEARCDVELKTRRDGLPLRRSEIGACGQPL